MAWVEWRRRWRMNCSLAFILSCIFICLVAKLRRDFSDRRLGATCLPKLRYRNPSAKVSNDTPSELHIPRILHQTWSSADSLPFLFRPWMESWVTRNADWEFWFWTDEDISTFIKQCYPNFVQLFESYPSAGYRADVFRYFVLYEFGGVYADIDTEALQPLDTVAKLEYCIVGQEPLEHAHFLGPMGIPLVSNAVMACIPRHRFFKRIIDDLASHVGYFTWNNILYATGPYMLTQEYHNYANNDNPHRHISLASADLFMPTIDESMLSMIKDTCFRGEVDYFMWPADVVVRRDLCNRLMSVQFSNSPKEGSVVNHHWTHTWATAKHDPWGVKNMRKYFDIQDIWPKGTKHR